MTNNDFEEEDVKEWQSEDHSPLSDRSAVITRTRFGHKGSLIGVHMGHITTLSDPNRCYVRLLIDDENDVEKHLLAYGYQAPRAEVTWNGSIPLAQGDQLRIESHCSQASLVLRAFGTIILNWYGSPSSQGTHQGTSEGPGAQRVITSTDPADNTEHSIPVPTNAEWKPEAMRTSLLTDVNVANRRTSPLMTNGTVEFWRGRAKVDQAASITRFTSWAPDTDDKESSSGDDERTSFIPDTRLGEGFTIDTSTKNLQATDNYAVLYLKVREWLKE